VARAYHEESLAMFRTLGDRRNIARALIHLGWVGIDQHAHAEAREHLTEAVTIARELADPRVMIDGLEIFAYLALGVDRPDRAARLQGAAETLRETIGLPVSPSEHIFYDADVAAARAGLGDAAFNAAWGEGRALSMEQAVAYALHQDSASA
jgi:non-specific serine/threonine protein kinase